VLIRVVVLFALASCQAKGEAPGAPQAIEVRDASGAVLASIVPGTPCSATIAGAAVDLSGWTADRRPNGTLIAHAGATVARVYGHDATLSVFDAHGVPLLRLDAHQGAVDVADGGRKLLRRAVMSGEVIVVDNPPATVTGTRDVELAALLASPELTAQVRALATCDRTS
jgi:hypothetical protein